MFTHIFELCLTARLDLLFTDDSNFWKVGIRNLVLYKFNLSHQLECFHSISNREFYLWVQGQGSQDRR
jgi:hypothetical protein